MTGLPTDRVLEQALHRLDRLSYAAYKQLRGSYQFPELMLHVDEVQGDPFAAPSRCRVTLPQAIAQFPPALYRSRSRCIALQDYLTRQFSRAAVHLSTRQGSGTSGLIAIAPTGQQVLERTSVRVSAEQVEVRFVVGLPAQGRRILGREAVTLLCHTLPVIVARSLRYASLKPDEVQHQVETVEDADWLRQQLAAHHLVAFVADGAILPRQSGASDQPLSQQAIPFRSPDSLRVTFNRPNQGPITGMGIPQGVTLIVGGGYHGKSTLLRAIALGIYNHIPGDGREQVVTDAQAMQIRAEDGRRVAHVNLTPFINHLPYGRSTTHFSTDNASGSTSQSANIIEALEAGATTLLIDEDTSATNFMIRDRRMQALIAKPQEPITPFIDAVRPLYTERGVSTILVMGSSGDYFDVADTVIAMTNFQPADVTVEARAIAAQYPTTRLCEGTSSFGAIAPRFPQWPSLTATHRAPPRWKKHQTLQPSAQVTAEPSEDNFAEGTDIAIPRFLKIKVRETHALVVGSETIDVSAIEQLVDPAQLQAIGAAIAHLQRHSSKATAPPDSLAQLLNQLMTTLDTIGLDALTPQLQGNLAAFRALELAATLNRFRALCIR